ncbi:MAG: winged helix-turn-helix domain-containing protein [Candidatus Acidiferrales bacterium]
MGDEIGTMAGVIWNVLNSKDELSLVQLKKEVKANSPLFDWAVGWLAREDKIVITPGKRTFCVRLKKEQAKAASAY